MEALNELLKTGNLIAALEDSIEEIVAKVKSGEMNPGEARTELSKVEGRAHKVEGNNIDEIKTSELNTGKVQAKDEKKNQLRRMEMLFETLETRFAWLKKYNADDP